ncbi:MAG: single-stranded DNA-binding protein [Pirellulales bacterium]
MASFNRVILVGNLTRDIELKYLPSGMAVTEVGLAVNERRKTQTGEWVDDVVFVDISLFGRTAEVAGEYLQKGSPVLIEGRLKYDTWEKDGKKQSKLRVVGDRMQMLGTRQGGGGGSNGGGGSSGGSTSAGRSANRAPAMPQGAGGEMRGSEMRGNDASASEMAGGYGSGMSDSGMGEGDQDIPF